MFSFIIRPVFLADFTGRSQTTVGKLEIVGLPVGNYPGLPIDDNATGIKSHDNAIKK